jgi:uncharacterized tellurite resistance protein B-like protein
MTELEKNEKLSLLVDLMKLANADNQVREAEYQFILNVAMQLDLTPEDVTSIFKGNIEYKLPEPEVERIVQFHRLVLLMNVDQDASYSEKELLRQIAKRMGLRMQAVDAVLQEMYNYQNRVIPAQRLIEIFTLYHN